MVTQELTPQMQKIEQEPSYDLDQAESTLVEIRKAVGDDPGLQDEALAGFTAAAEQAMEDGTPEEIQVAETAGLGILTGSVHNETAQALNRMPIDSLGPALAAIESGRGSEAAAEIMDQLDKASHDSPPGTEQDPWSVSTINWEQVPLADEQTELVLLPSQTAAEDKARAFLERMGDVPSAGAIDAISERIARENTPETVSPEEELRPLQQLASQLEGFRQTANTEETHAAMQDPRTPVHQLLEMARQNISNETWPVADRANLAVERDRLSRTMLHHTGYSDTSLLRRRELKLDIDNLADFSVIPGHVLRDMIEVDERFRFIVDRAVKIDEHSISSKQLRAKVEGYNLLSEKLVAISRGDIVDDNLKPMDILLELGSDKESLTESEIVDTAHDFLVGGTGLSQERASELVAAVYGRCSVSDGLGDERSRRLDTQLVKRELARTHHAFERIGLDAMNTLRETCGIVNIGELSDDQLDRMVRFAHGDTSLSQELQSKEVCVILRDATQDWNGAFEGAYKNYETNQDSTLIFEVSSLADGGAQVRSFAEQLEQSGIDASALVIMGHGLPGGVLMGDKYLIPVTPQVVTSRSSNSVTFAEAGLDKIIGNMKPDRDGNCTVIYKSCSSGGALAHEDDSTLSRTAEVAREAGFGKSYQLLGTKTESNPKLDKYGDLEDVVSQQHITRIVVGKYGAIYSQDSVTAPRLPMFRTDTVDLRKQPPGFASTQEAIESTMKEAA